VRALAARLAELVPQKEKLALMVRPAAAEDPVGKDDEAALARIFDFVRTHKGHDFAKYKRTTILRRLTRRMQLNRIDGLGHYLRLLRENPEEVHSLFDDLLITVTSFFRDPEAWEALRLRVVVPLV
jgi:two-component system CheB/CheR fusion protein